MKNYDEKLDIYNKILNEMREIYISKNSDYGDSVGTSFKKFGDISFLVRMYDKFNRLENLVIKNNIKVKDEKIEDTLKDLANYCILWLIELKNNNR